MTEKYISISLDKAAGECLCVAGELKLSELLRRMSEKNITLSSAESCTGGLIGKLITDVSGASAVYAGGVISYTNDVKINILGVEKSIIDEHTEVSRETAAAMASRARELFGTDIGVATTGFAGPGGGTEKEPKGTVYVAVSTSEATTVVRISHDDEATRGEIRRFSAFLCLEIVERIVKNA